MSDVSNRIVQKPIPAMKIDVLGRIRNMQVPVQHGFHPVFEAVVNSIHATAPRPTAAPRS